MKTAEEIRSLLKIEGLHKDIGNGEVEVISPWEILKRENIKLHIADLSVLLKDYPSAEKLGDISGCIFKSEGDFSIYINEKDHKNRQQFTLAHELGHYFLHQDYFKDSPGIVDTKDTILFRVARYDTKEKEANLFAAEYLMPYVNVKNLYARFGIVEILANHFGVSRAAMAYRIDNICEDV